jgi:hypothetical protein
MFHVQPLLASQREHRGSGACCVIATLVAKTVLENATNFEDLLQELDGCVAQGSKLWLGMKELRHYHPKEVLELLPTTFETLEIVAEITSSITGEAADGFVQDTRKAVEAWMARQRERPSAIVVTRNGYTFVAFKWMHLFWCVDSHANSIEVRKKAFQKAGFGRIIEGSTGFVANFPLPDALVDFVFHYCEAMPEAPREHTPLYDSDQVQLVEVSTK